MARPHAPLLNTRIAIATSHGRHYYRFARSLRALGIRFDSITPKSMSGYDGDLVLCTRDETSDKLVVPVLHEDVSDKHPVILCGMILQKIRYHISADEMVLGVDPGNRTGLSVFYCGCEIGTSFHTSIDELVLHMIELMVGLGARKKIVRIGCGNMEMTRQICDQLNLRFCSSFELELVNEHGTSPKMRNFNSRGKRDMLSARSIAQRSGHKHTVLPHSISI